MKAIIITYNDSYDYNTRTKYVERYLKEKGYDVEFLISNFDHRKKCIYKVLRENVTYISVPAYRKNISIGRLYSCCVFAKKVKEYLLNTKLDLVYHCAPPNCTIKELSKVKKKYNFFLITELGDMWPESFPVSTRIKKIMTVPFKLWSSLRDNYLYNSDYVITECELFNKVLYKNSSIKKIKTLYFCQKWKADYVIPAIDNDNLSFCYLGSINNIIDIELIVKMMKYLNCLKQVTIHVIGDGEKRETFLQSIKSTGVDVVFHGMVFDDDVKKSIFSKCHFGLNIMKTDVFVGMTMKSLDYFSYGLPLINNIRGDIWDMVEKEQIGFNVNNNCYTDMCDRLICIDNDIYKEMRNNIYQTHSKYFSVESFRNAMNDIIE